MPTDTEILDRDWPGLKLITQGKPCKPIWKEHRVHDRKALKAAKAAGRCENKKCRHKITVNNPLETHHVKSRSQGGGDEPSNLMALCHNCHTAFHNDPKIKDDILDQVAKRGA